MDGKQEDKEEEKVPVVVPKKDEYELKEVVSEPKVSLKSKVQELR